MSSVQTAGLLNNKQQSIDQSITDINNDIKSIRKSLVFDKTNNGLEGLTVKSSSLLGKDGLINPKANFFDVYYDESGKPYFLFNQFNPLFGFFKSRGNKQAYTNACSYCSTANAFILGAGVHSVVDSLGIYLFTLDRGRDSNSPINNNEWYNLLSGNTKGWEKYDNYKIIKKYIFEKKDKLAFKPTTSKKVDDDVMDFIRRDKDSATFVFTANAGTNGASMDKIIARAEEAGYDVHFTIGNAAGGKSGNVFGSLGDSGHYVGADYQTGKPAMVIDSFGSRSSAQDRQDGVELAWSAKSQPLEYNEKRSPIQSVKTKGKHQFWHENSVMTGTDYVTYGKLMDGANISGGSFAYLTLTKK